MLSHTADYTIHAMIGIAAIDGDRRCTNGDIARMGIIPKYYTAYLVRLLKQKGLVVGKKGRNGGLYLAKSPNQISVLEIIESIEGRITISSCTMLRGNKTRHHRKGRCAVTDFFNKLQNVTVRELSEMTLDRFNR